ncbi:hypothetical protein [Tropicimonas sp. IMCC6043]|uniref:hypothetical protein n=1 Tax=Tropicimonas sp. IMCC6043 TaxID=2510645 RepID=UPI00101E1664|nr:hypothetical protein [Tropicimonas sp. IMCC6043]RYH10962.1 hypothetical protein EU800_06860 [Tropicimonas sp. IMCC6043]
MTAGFYHHDLFWAALLGLSFICAATLAQAATLRGESDGLAAQTRLPVTGSSVVVAAPRGYCIDPLASIEGARAAFVLMASCHSVTGDRRAPHPAIRGLLTASVDGSRNELPSPRELGRYFASEAGRAALARSGDAAATELGASFSRNGVFFLQARETGGDPAFGGRSWRAVFELNGRMVTATFRDLAGFPVTADEGFRAVGELVEEIRAASPVR